jgi:hypothetical protein
MYLFNKKNLFHFIMILSATRDVFVFPVTHQHQHQPQDNQRQTGKEKKGNSG